MIQSAIDIQELIPPDDVSFWPPQPGWYILLLITGIILIIGSIKLIKHKKRNAFRALALQSLEQIHRQNPPETSITLINNLLKACALKTYPREQVAVLVGEEWINFLNGTSRNSKFNALHAELTRNEQYKKNNAAHISKEVYEAFYLASKTWVRTHKLYKN